MTNTKFYNITKTRLNRRNYKGFTKEDYQNAADHVGVSDLNNPSEDELNKAVEFLIKQRDKSNSVLQSQLLDESEIASGNEEEKVLPEVLESEIEPTRDEQNTESSESSAITPQDEGSLSMPEAEAIIQQTIALAPSQLKQELIKEYASQQFNSVAQLVALKHAIDNKVNAFLASEFAKSNKENTANWSNILTEFKERKELEAANRQEQFQVILSNLDAKIAEFKVD